MTFQAEVGASPGAEGAKWRSQPKSELTSLGRSLAMMCHHCAPSDFDEIAALGFDNFSSATLEPYFKKSQSHVESPAWPLRRAGKNAAPGDGPVQTGFSWINELCSAFVKACVRLGMEIRADVNDLSDGMGTMGVSRTKTFIHKGCEFALLSMTVARNCPSDSPSSSIPLGQLGSPLPPPT